MAPYEGPLRGSRQPLAGEGPRPLHGVPSGVRPAATAKRQCLDTGSPLGSYPGWAVAADDDPIRMLERAIAQMGVLVAGIRPEQAGLSTPCPEFDVRALVNHVVYDLRTFKAMLAGEQRASPDVDLIGDDWSAAYRSAADSLLDGWHSRGLAGTLQLQIGEVPPSWAASQHLADVAVHAWDIARATGQSAQLDPELAQTALDWARGALKPQFRGPGMAFGTEVAVPEDAPINDRLVGFFGRDPAWKR